MELSREQCLNIKGYGILLIVIHNFVDHLMGINCNEMAYYQAHTDAFIQGVLSPAALWYVFAFAGWIGVALFLFASGYGLTRKYGCQSISHGDYIWKHLVKLWILLVPVYLLYFITYHCVLGGEHNWYSLIAQLTFTINFLDYGTNSFISEPRVYWFFGAILQFYILFLALRKMSNRWLWITALLALGFNYLILYRTYDVMMWWTRQNAIGWMVPFVMGMLAARIPFRPRKRLCLIVCLTALPLLVLSLTIKALAPFTEVFTVLFFVSLTGLLTMRLMTLLGVISASLFVIHPFVRMLCYNGSGHFHVSELSMVGIYIVAVVALSWIHHIILKKVQTGWLRAKNE